MAHVIGLSGSLRRASLNTALLKAAASVTPAGSRIEIASIRDIPLYDGDVEAAEGIPPAVQVLKDAIAAADAVLIATPEYNNSVPGVLKNAIDWLSRPPADIRRVFGGKPIAIMGATTGPGMTALAQVAWLPVFRTLGTLPWFGGRLAIPHAGKLFDEAGQIADEAIRSRLEAFVKGFVEFAGQMSTRAAGRR